MNSKSMFFIFYGLFFCVFLANNVFTQLQSFEHWQLINEDTEFMNLRTTANQFNTKSSCSLTAEEKAEIESYRDVVNKIFDESINGTFKGRTYKTLGTFVDKFGSRLSGSESLEKSINFMLAEMEKSELANIHAESVEVPNWKRGDEVAKLITPRAKPLAISTLGYSVATQEEGITAEAIVIQSFDELLKRQADVKGKIVIYSSRGRNAFALTMVGAALASRFGAVAALARTSAPFSLNTPHTGIQVYDSTIPKIPVAALSSEDGDLLFRLAEAGEQLQIYLKISILSSGTTESRNIIGDYKGIEKPDEFVVLSGHIDSWDVGQGALDDGVGVVLTSEAINLFKTLKLQPRRTIRTIYWTAEEMGLFGGKQYVKEHKDSMGKYAAALEADFGCLKAMGYIFSGDSKIGCFLAEVMNLMSARANLTQLFQIDFMPTDVAGFTMAGIPTVVLHGDNGKYFWYHHTEADVLTALESKELDICLGVWAATSFIIADMKENLPKHSPRTEGYY